MSRCIVSDEALRDLSDIWEFIAADNIDAADRQIDVLEAAFERLCDRPHIGHVRPEVSDNSIRFWRVKSYLVAYQPDHKPLSIVRILHGARDLNALLGD